MLRSSRLLGVDTSSNLGLQVGMINDFASLKLYGDRAFSDFVELLRS
jgi:hypothetical protein